MSKYADLLEESPPKGKYSDLLKGDEPEKDALEHLHPSTSRYFRENKGKISPTSAMFHAVSDLLGIPTRAAAAAFTDQEMSDPDSHLFKQQAEAAKEKSREGRENFQDRPGETPEQTYFRMQNEGVNATPESMQELPYRLASDPLVATGAVKTGIKSAVENIPKAFEHGAAVVGSAATGKTVKALKTASTKEGGKAIIEAGKDAGSAGIKFADRLASFEKNLPERGQVEAALKVAKPLDIRPVIDVLEKAKSEIPTKSGFTTGARDAAISKIDGLIERLKVNKGGKAKPGQAFKTKFDAEEYRQIRQILDEDIDFSEPWAKPFGDALYQARTEMKNALIDASPKEYAKAMESWHKKLDVIGEIKKKIGKAQGVTQEERAGGVLRKAAGEEPGSEGSPLRNLVSEFDQAAGTENLSQADLAEMADEFTKRGEGGKILNPNQIGKPSKVPNVYALSGRHGDLIPSAAFTGGVIPAARGTGKAIERIPSNLANASIIAKLIAALKTAKSQDQKAAIERKLAELESQ